MKNSFNALEIASIVGDAASQGLLTQRILFQEKTNWMFRSLTE